MAEYTQDSTFGDRVWNAGKSFVHNGFKAAVGGAVAGAVVFAAATFLFGGGAAVGAAAGTAALFGYTELTGALFSGAIFGAASIGSVGALFGAFNEMVKPPQETPILTPPNPRIISRAEAKSLEPAIEIGDTSKMATLGKHTERLAQERAQIQQSHSIH